MLITWRVDGSLKYQIYPFIIYLSFYIGIGFLGYFLNDISDVASDKAAGKNNIASNLKTIEKAIIILISTCVGVLPISFHNPAVITLICLEILLLFSYSFPPFRLKERGFLGVITDSLYAYVVPSLILLTYLDSIFEVDSFFWYFLPLFGFFLGVRNILDHQLDDYDNDLVSGTKTFVTNNPNRAKHFITFFVLISILIWVTGTIIIQISNTQLLFISFFFTIVSIFLVFRLILYLAFRKDTFLKDVPESLIIHYGLIITLTFIIIEEKWFALFLLPALFNHYSRKKLYLILKLGFHQFRTVAGLAINYFLYYSLLLIGIDLKERAEKKANKHISTVKKLEILSTVNEKNIHALWIGKELSLMELLTIQSFLANGYHFHLWTYDTLTNELPQKCIICDANEIISKEHVFKYKYSSQFGTGKGSFAGFSDIFRYKLLFEKGGWWVDMDVTCLKPFDVESPYFFRGHHDLPLVGNVMKAPKGSELMKKCFEEANQEINENNRDWHKPIDILVRNVFDFELDKYIFHGLSNTDEWHKLKPYVHSNQQDIPESWYFIHWCNEVWRTNGYDKNSPLYASFYGKSLMNYQLIPFIPENQWRDRDRKVRTKLMFDKLIDYI